MMKKKIVIFIMMLSLFITTYADHMFVFAADENYYEIEYNLNPFFDEKWKNVSVGEYPIDFCSTEWKEMSYCEALDAINMPEEYAKKLTTKELVQFMSNYPFLYDIFLFESLEDGMNHLKNTSVVFKELLTRNDYIKELLKEYIGMTCDYEKLEDMNDVITSHYAEKVFLEIYFGLNYDLLSEEEITKFINGYKDKYEKQPQQFRKYNLATIFYEAINEAMGYIPESVILTDFLDDIVEIDSTNELSFTKTSIFKKKFTNGAKYYYGYQMINGKKVYCYKYCSGEYSTEEKKKQDEYIEKYHSTFVKISTATKKYNCHSYAWYTTNASNNLWINDPANVFNNTEYYTKWRVPMVSPDFGDRILFYTDSNLKHSAILLSSTMCKSKLGSCGVFKATISEIKKLYDANSTQSYITNGI